MREVVGDRSETEKRTPLLDVMHQRQQYSDGPGDIKVPWVLPTFPCLLVPVETPFGQSFSPCFAGLPKPCGRDVKEVQKHLS